MQEAVKEELPAKLEAQHEATLSKFAVHNGEQRMFYGHANYTIWYDD
jgi:hypothetical protein